MIFHPIFDPKMAEWIERQGYTFPPRLVVQFSGGKDSTAMVHRMVESCFPIDALLFFDGGWEFPEMYDHINFFEKKTGLSVTRIYPNHPFDDLLKKYRWPDARRRWCTREKINAGTRYINQNFDNKTDYVIHCIGFAADEIKRCDTKEQLKRGRVLFPLIDDVIFDPRAVGVCYDRKKAMQEVDALRYCYNLGYHWDGLYDHFDRVSCFCCPLKKMRELRALRDHYPELWIRALEMESSIPVKSRYVTFKGRRSLHAIDRLFECESRQMELAFAGTIAWPG